MHDRAEEAEKVLIALHKRQGDPENIFARKELQIIKTQIDYEAANRMTVAEALRKPSLRKRFIIGFLAMWDTQCSGLIVVLGKWHSSLLTRSHAHLFSVSSDHLRIPRIHTVHGRHLGLGLVCLERDWESAGRIAGRLHWPEEADRYDL